MDDKLAIELSPETIRALHASGDVLIVLAVVDGKTDHVRIVESMTTRTSLAGVEEKQIHERFTKPMWLALAGSASVAW